ncbi:MAG: OmpA family protein [Syntrophobacterales bacterium]|nr:OmpA family protein [Syntrophobacterales bacterium]
MKEQKPIIKKVKKVSGGGHHGGSWKVAYADFVTAMMAFFLLLWLITMTSPEKRARLAHYFKYFSIFEKSGSSILDGQTGVTPYPGAPLMEQIKESESKKEEKPPDHFDVGSEIGGVPKLRKAELVEKLKFLVQYSLMEVKDQVMIDTVPEGVRIQVVDQEGRSMFAPGSAQLSPEAKKILKVITDAINGLDNKITIDGHTDATGYSAGRYTNWELATARASAARQEMERNGLDPDRISRVSGYAATQPLFPENPNDPRNRRISITILFPEGSGRSGR